MRFALALLLFSYAALADHAKDGAQAMQQHDFGRAAREYQAATQEAPKEQGNWVQLALALQQQNDFAGSIKAYDRAFALADCGAANGNRRAGECADGLVGAVSPAVLYNAACAFARAGQKERALSLLEQIADQPLASVQQLKGDPDLASLQSEPRFAKVLAKSEETAHPKVTKVSVSAEEVVAKTLAARGGAERIKAVRSERLSGEISFGAPGPGAPFSVELKRPGKLRDQVTLQGEIILRATDGHSGYSQEGKNPPRALSAGELRNLAGSADFEGPLVDAQAKGNRIELLGMTKVSGRDAYQLRITQKDGQVRTDYVDCATFLEVKWQGSLLLQGKETMMETLFSDFRDVDGIKVPFRMDSDTPGTANRQQIIYQKVEIDPALDDARFAGAATSRQ